MKPFRPIALVRELFATSAGSASALALALLLTATIAKADSTAVPDQPATPKPASHVKQHGKHLKRAHVARPKAEKPAPAAASESNDDLLHRPTLLGDMGGFRPAIAKFGLTLTIQETSEVLGNVSGGRRQGFDYDGLTTATAQLDTQPAFGWAGGLFNVSALQIHGANLSAENLLTLQTASGIEAAPATRLWELWFQQKFFDDRLDIRVGQQSIDQEFMVSQNSNCLSTRRWDFPSCHRPTCRAAARPIRCPRWAPARILR